MYGPRKVRVLSRRRFGTKSAIAPEGASPRYSSNEDGRRFHQSRSNFDRIVSRVLSKNPELHEAPDRVDDLYTMLDFGLFGFNFYGEEKSNKIFVDGDFPVPVEYTDEVVKELENAGYKISDIHHSKYEDDVHFLTETTP